MKIIPRRVCKKCGTEAVGEEEIEAAFRSKNWTQYTGSKPYRSTVCNLCRITARTEAKRRDRYLSKARNTRSKHAKKFGMPGITLRDDFGWTDEALTAGMKAAHALPCPECGDDYRILDDLTLDISDPTRSPHYPDNAKWMCRTCNTAKSSTPRHLWDARKRYERRWQVQWARLRDLIQLGLWGDEKNVGKKAA